MACTLEGEIVGSISGGCIEEDFLKQLQEGKLKDLYRKQRKPFTVVYGETEAEQTRLKLPCGGQLHVLLELLRLGLDLQDVLRRHAPAHPAGLLRRRR